MSMSKIISKVKQLSIMQGVLTQSPEPEAHDNVLDNNPDRISWNLEMLVFEERGKL